MSRWIMIASLVAFATALGGCRQSAPTQRIRVYVPKDEAPKPTTSLEKKKRSRRGGEDPYSTPGRLKSSGVRIFDFLVPKGLRRGSHKTQLITMEALLPLEDVARFYKLRTDEYIVVDQGRGYKVLSKAKLGTGRSDDYRGPVLYINRNSEGMARLVFFEPKPAPTPGPTADNTSKTPSPSPSPSPSPTPTPAPTPSGPGTKSPDPSTTISMKPSKMNTGPSRFTAPTNTGHKSLDLGRMPQSLQNAIKTWENRHPGKKFEM